MDKEQILLIQLTEECSEVSKRCSKALRFGLHEVQPGQSLTNKQRIEDEVIDLLALIDILQEENIIDLTILEVPYELTRDKREKVKKYLEYSKQLGVLR